MGQRRVAGKMFGQFQYYWPFFLAKAISIWSESGAKYRHRLLWKGSFRNRRRWTNWNWWLLLLYKCRSVWIKLKLAAMFVMVGAKQLWMQFSSVHQWRMQLLVRHGKINKWTAEKDLVSRRCLDWSRMHNPERRSHRWELYRLQDIGMHWHLFHHGLGIEIGTDYQEKFNYDKARRNSSLGLVSPALLNITFIDDYLCRDYLQLLSLPQCWVGVRIGREHPLI